MNAVRASVSRGSGPATNQTTNVAAARTRTSGTKTSAIRSARRWIGAFEPWARWTRSTIRASAVSRPTRVARMTNVPVVFSGRADDLVARPDRDRDRLAGQHRCVDRRAALDDDAVDRDRVAGPDAQQVADRDGLERDLAVARRRATTRAVAGLRPTSRRIAPVVRPLARASSQRPSRTSPMMIVDESK